MQAKTLLPNLGNGNTIIFGCIVGSHAYGTNVEGSDVDKKWIYVQSAHDIFMNGYKPQIELSKDEVAFELSRFIELAQKANPTILELLFSPEDCVIYKHPCMERLLYIRREFLTKQCRFSFGGYAISQIEKARGLDKKMNWEKEKTDRKSVLDFCYWVERAIDPRQNDQYQSAPIKKHFTLTQLKRMGLSAIPHTRDLYNLVHDSRYALKGVVSDEETANDISVSEVPRDANNIGLLYFNKDACSIHCKEYREYQEWLQKRNTQRYVDIASHGQSIDGKNLLHCVRLIETALDIAEHKELIVRRDNAEFLKNIRKGTYDLNWIITHAQQKIERMDQAFMNSSLSEKFVSPSAVKYINFEIRKQINAEKEVSITKSNY
jgi:predicted nucleotidyltransferase